MPCTPPETALLLVAERGGSDVEPLRRVLLERFPSLTFPAATELLAEAIRVREHAFSAGKRVLREEVTREAALAELNGSWPETSADALERFLDLGILDEAR